MPRRNVCDNANIGCSDGFHAGSLDYARQYGNGGHLMVVEIDPADVVSVPLDCDQQKLRTSKYKVVSLFEKKLEEPMCDDYGRITKVVTRITPRMTLWMDSTKTVMKRDTKPRKRI